MLKLPPGSTRESVRDVYSPGGVVLSVAFGEGGAGSTLLPLPSRAGCGQLCSGPLGGGP